MPEDKKNKKLQIIDVVERRKTFTKTPKEPYGEIVTFPKTRKISL